MRNSADNNREDVWPPAIAYPPLTRPICLNEAQLKRIHYRWFHVAGCLIVCVVGADEYFLLRHGLWHSLVSRAVLSAVCLFVFGGNLWRAIQAWRLKAILDQSGE
jgi:hypothetical protein